ncbi:MAG: CPBP family intramembrane metalloprotease [Deltaproteobacteria bacterium]|nr:CPBP family intramembrane metalloprotease [Deltaproteobacteria bacterium]
MNERLKPVVLFYVLTVVGGWGLVAAFLAAGGDWVGPSGRFIAILQMFPVALAALVVQGPVLKRPLKLPFGLNLKVNRSWLFAWLAPALILIVALLVAALWPGQEVVTSTAEYIATKRAHIAATEPQNLAAFNTYVHTNPPNHPFSLILMALPVGLTFNLLLALAEEIGWRGFLHAHLRVGFFQRSLIVGLLWGVYLLPDVATGFIFGDHIFTGAALILAHCLALSPILEWIRVRSGSVVACALFRGTAMALTRVGLDLVPNVDPRVPPLYGWTGLVAILLTLGALLLFDRFWAKEPVVFRTSPSPAAGA